MPACKVIFFIWAHTIFFFSFKKSTYVMYAAYVEYITQMHRINTNLRSKTYTQAKNSRTRAIKNSLYHFFNVFLTEKFTSKEDPCKTYTNNERSTNVAKRHWVCFFIQWTQHKCSKTFVAYVFFFKKSGFQKKQDRHLKIDSAKQMQMKHSFRRKITNIVWR